jgi:hypothetical protein
MIDFDCPLCGEPMSVPRCIVGELHDCPRCRRDVTVPGTEQELACVRNPFSSGIVADPWKPLDADVQDIHREAFDLCCRAVEAVRTEHRSYSVLLHGEAGSGKTHLIGRLRRRLLEQNVIFVSIQLRTSPQRLWRHVRQHVADDLLRACDGGETQFVRALARRLDEPSGASHALRAVLGILSRNGHDPDARAWLRGDALPESAMTRLGLAPDSDEEELPEDKARDIVLQLCRLAGMDNPLVLCFDQVEALQQQMSDRESIYLFGKMMSTLHDQTENVVLISCIKSIFKDPLYDACDQADQARLASYDTRGLAPLNFDQAVRLAIARMDTDPDLWELRFGRSNRVWPLREADVKAWFDSQTGRTAVARKVIAYCRDLFEMAPSAEGAVVATAPAVPQQIPQREVGDFLRRRWQQRQEEAIRTNKSARTDDIIAQAVPFLVDALQGPWHQEPSSGIGDVDMLFKSSDGRHVAVSLCNERNMTSLAARFRRLLQRRSDGIFENLVLVRDPRVPITRTAVKTREYLAELKQRGARLVQPSTEILAALDALRALLSDAKAGDLADAGETVEPKTVAEWIAANLPPALQGFLDEVFSPPSALPAEEVPDGFLDLLQERRVLLLDEAAEELDKPAGAIEQWVRRNSGQVGILNGPPAVLFQYVPESFPAQEDERA